MATQRDILRRIRSVEKTQQITSAMRMVAAAKLRRAQDAIIAARPYAERMQATLRELGRRESEDTHPLFEHRALRNTLELLVVTSDRGLCGAFNSGVLKHAEAVLAQHGPRFAKVAITPVGRKAEEYFRKRRPDEVTRSWTGIDNPSPAVGAEIAHHIAHRFIEGEIDEAVIVGNEFVSALTQRPVDLHLLPFGTEEPTDEDAGEPIPYDMEPSAAGIIDVLVPQAIEFTIYSFLLENAAGEHAARMTAMESATRNTEELIKSLTLQYNRARQAAITKELVEIVTGAQALE